MSQKTNMCSKCGSKKVTKFGDPINRGDDKVQRVRCDKCGQMRMNVIKPRKKKEAFDALDSNSEPADS
jgi:uncharacterized Zn finger protein